MYRHICLFIECSRVFATHLEIFLDCVTRYVPYPRPSSNLAGESGLQTISSPPPHHSIRSLSYCSLEGLNWTGQRC
jgi:hypothetical protein